MPTLGVWGQPAQPPAPVECPRCKLVSAPAFDGKCLRCGSDLAASAQGPERRNTMSDYYLGVESKRATEADPLSDDDQTAAPMGGDGDSDSEDDDDEVDADGRRKKRKRETMTTTVPPVRPTASPVRPVSPVPTG